MSDPLHWSKFYWNDWATDPKLSQCSLAAQGLWARILCEMARQDPPGRLPVDTHGVPLSASIRHLLGELRTIRRLTSQLIDWKVCDINDGYMISRRMVRDWHRIQQGQQAAAKRWGKTSSAEPNGSPNGSDNGSPNSEAFGTVPKSYKATKEERAPPRNPPSRGGRTDAEKHPPRQKSRNGFIDSMLDDLEQRHANQPEPGPTVVAIPRPPERH